MRGAIPLAVGGPRFCVPVCARAAGPNGRVGRGPAVGRQCEHRRTAGRLCSWRGSRMASEYERHLAAVIAKGMAVMCFRNTPIEDFHDRTAPVTHTGDFSDVVVIDANGRRIPWREVSHISQDEMRDLMRTVVNRLYTCQLYAGRSGLLRNIELGGLPRRGRGTSRNSTRACWRASNRDGSGGWRKGTEPHRRPETERRAVVGGGRGAPAQ